MNTWMIPAVLAVALVAGCESPTGGYKQPIGGILGGVGGGLIGAQIGGGQGRLIATSAGALLGAMIGSSAGASLDRADQAYTASFGGLRVASPRTSVPQWSPPSYTSTQTVRGIAPASSGRLYAANGYSPGYALASPRMGLCSAGGGGVCENIDGTWSNSP